MTGATLLLRQVHPSFVQAGRPSSQAFRPTPKDEGLLSVYDGDQIDGEAAWTHFTTVLNLPSAGVLAVTPTECQQQDPRLMCRADPEPFKEHAVIDFTALNDSQREKAGKKLKAVAEVRGWLFRPVGGS